MFLLSLVAALLAADAPALTHRVLILGGGKSAADAERFLAPGKSLCRLAEGYPKALKSDDVVGMKPGFVVAVAGACAKDDAACLIALDHCRQSTRSTEGLYDAKPYYRDVSWKEPAGPKPHGELKPLENPAGIKAMKLDAGGSFEGLAVITADGAQVIDELPVMKFAGKDTFSCSPVYQSQPVVTATGIELAWLCSFPGGGGNSSPPTMEVSETLTVKDGKLQRAFKQGKSQAAQRD